MCGIVGIVGEGVGGPEDRAIVERMLATIVHRGPDDGAQIAGEGFVLGARRLSIVDVEHGRQPVANDRGDVVVALNGEIYDHEALRREGEARGVHFRTRSDTEVLLSLIDAEGEGCLERLEGMYAFAAFDARTRALLLVRDRLGEKPLVWFESKGRIVFASEMRALAVHPDAPRAIDPDAIALHLLHRFVPAPRTMIRGIHRLPPGCKLTYRGGRAEIAPYWSLPVPGASGGPGALTRAQAAQEVTRRLEAAVESRLAAEVPVGVFLSGGVDSSAIAALASRRRPIDTFTLRPFDADFDEGDAARTLATAIRSRHHEVPVDAAAIERGFETIFARIDEPIGDSSLVPTWLLSRAAREHVKVALGGEGADELFGGYPTYLGARMAKVARVLPRPLRRFGAWLAGGGGHRNVGTRWLIRRLLDGADVPVLERHLLWFGAFPVAEQMSLFRPDARPAIVGEGLLEPIRAAAAPALATGDVVDPLLRVDLLLHLPDALLAKVDRASMLASLEVRAPFLERGLVELAAGLPAAFKVKGLRTKLVLRDALEGVVPSKVLHRRKRGFAIPVARALAGSLGTRLRERLATSAIAREHFETSHLARLLDEHAAGRADHARRLYTVLSLLEWEASARA